MQTTIHALSPDMLACVFEFLPGSHLAMCGQVCANWYTLASDARLWHLLCTYKGTDNLQNLDATTTKYFANNHVLQRASAAPESYKELYKQFVLWNWDTTAKGSQIQLVNNCKTAQTRAALVYQENEWQAVRGTMGKHTRNNNLLNIGFTKGKHEWYITIDKMDPTAQIAPFWSLMVGIISEQIDVTGTTRPDYTAEAQTGTL